MTATGEETTTVRGTFGFNAPAEVVFGVLTDPDRVPRWLPPGATADLVGGGERLRVRTGNGHGEYEVEIIAERMEVRWRAAGGPVPHGSARVSDAPAGGSQLDTEVSAPAWAGEERVRRTLDETATRLRRDVSDNFNAG